MTEGEHLQSVLDTVMKPMKVAMTQHRIDAIRAADSRICIRNIGVTEEIEDAVVNAFDSDECEEIEIIVQRNHFRDGWNFPHRVTAVHNGIEANFEFESVTKTDAGYSICFERD